MKQIRKYRDFYNNIKYRTNVFEWYPFKEDAKYYMLVIVQF